MVPLSKSGVRKHRGFESRPLRHPRSHTDRPTMAGPDVSGERSPSGLWRRTGNAVRGNPSRVRISPSPPPWPGTGRRIRALTPCGPRSRTFGCARCDPPAPPSSATPCAGPASDPTGRRIRALTPRGPRSRTFGCARCDRSGAAFVCDALRRATIRSTGHRIRALPARSSLSRRGSASAARLGVSFAGRARRGTSGAL